MAAGARASGLRKRRRMSGSKPVAKRQRLAPVSALSIRSMYPTQLGKFRTKLRYFDRDVQVNPGAAGITGSHVFSANSLFDPDRTGVGHQPAGFDQIMLLYQHFTVHSAKITIDCRNDDTSNPQLILVASRDVPATHADPRVYVENGACIYKKLQMAPESGSMGRLTYYVDIAKYLGYKDLISEDTTSGSDSANPVEEVFFHVVGFTSDANGDGGNLTFEVAIEYDVTFHERRDIALS